MFAPYRRLFDQPGTFAFVIAGLIGRFPLSMLGLGAVLLVTGNTAGSGGADGGSYGLAGAVSATMALANAATAPLIGTASDRLGQARVLVPSVVGHLIGVVGLVVVGVTHGPAWLYFPAAVVTGAAVPQVSSMVRTRWAGRVGDPAALSTAFSLESVLDEVVFVIGPVLATVLATLVWSAGGIAAAGVLATIGALLLAARRDSEPGRHVRIAGQRHPSAIAVPGLRVLMITFLALGGVFGTVDVSMVAFAAEHGHKPVSGLLLALLAFGSLVSGLLYGTREWTWSLRDRLIVGAAGLLVASTAVALAPSIPVMAVVVVVAGLAIAPTLVAGMGLVEALVPAAARTEGFSWAITALAVGVAVGSSLAGVVVDLASGHRAFLLGVAAAGVGLLSTAVGRRALAARAPDPVTEVADMGR